MAVHIGYDADGANEPEECAEIRRHLERAGFGHMLGRHPIAQIVGSAINELIGHRIAKPERAEVERLNKRDGNARKEPECGGAVKLVLKKQIHGCCAGASTLDVYMERWFDLPFVPHIGLCIRHGDFHATITELVYRVDQRMFVGYTEPDKEIYNAQLHKNDHRPIDEIVAEYESEGWERKRREGAGCE